MYWRFLSLFMIDWQVLNICKDKIVKIPNCERWDIDKLPKLRSQGMGKREWANSVRGIIECTCRYQFCHPVAWVCCQLYTAKSEVCLPSSVLLSPEAQQSRMTRTSDSDSSRAFWIPVHFTVGYLSCPPRLFLWLLVVSVSHYTIEFGEISTHLVQIDPPWVLSFPWPA